MNDFDEAAIFDFHIDVLRIAVSICNHGSTNGFVEKDLREALEAFTFTYVDTVSLSRSPFLGDGQRRWDTGRAIHFSSSIPFLLFRQKLL